MTTSGLCFAGVFFMPSRLHRELSLKNQILGWGIVIATIVVFVWVGVGPLAHAEEQSVGISDSRDMIGKLVKNLDGKNLGTIQDLVINWRSGG